MSDSEGSGASPSAGGGVVKCSEVVLEVRARTDVTAMWVVGWARAGGVGRGALANGVRRARWI